MTQQDSPPAAVTGNPVPPTLTELDPINPEGSGQGQAPPIGQEDPEDVIVPADVGATGVQGVNSGVDSPAGDAPSSRPPSPTPDDDHVTQVLAGFSLLSSGQREDVLRIVDPRADIPAVATAVVRPETSTTLFTEEAERPAPSTVGDHKFGIHPEVVKLAQYRQHLPLSLFLYKSQKDLFMKPSLAREQHIVNGSKVYLIKMDQFPDETHMDYMDWTKGAQGIKIPT
ncbi:hypothetical protein BJ912DRAFT_1067977 [Pholiota molesta]|nr:hypothetical protein BJ912DRAFT_1067977 [Pholiota molesta]